MEKKTLSFLLLSIITATDWGIEDIESLRFLILDLKLAANIIATAVVDAKCTTKKL
jgi:hypothetical protein